MEQPSSQDFARVIVDTLSDLKGEDIVLMDLRDITIITDYFVICTSDNERQARAMVEKINEKMKHEYGLRSVRAEGEASGGWVLMDYGDVVVHIFSEEQREYYDLEGLWQEGRVLLRMQ
ncbi:MAG: ribosome silencing factor [Anaerolineales bacterium]|nr:ribosome silencing factor [Anaerolineales bacterium]